MKKCKSLFCKSLKKPSAIVFLLLFSIISLLSCSKKSPQWARTDKKNEAVASNKKTIGFSIDTLAIERWQRDLDVFMNKAKEMNADVIVQNAGNDVDEQNRQLMYLVDRNVDVIVVLPKDAEAMTESIQKIKSKNIPVISYDRLVLNADIDLYLTINSEKVGELMAKGMRNVSHGPDWFCILGSEEDYNMTLIQRGINKVIYGSPIHIVHTFYTSGWNYDLAYQEMIRLITNNQIPDAILCGNDAVAQSVISALNLYYKDVHIPICGQDADIVACQYIVEGKQDFTIYKPITKLAELAAEYAVNLANGKKIEDFVQDPDFIGNGFDSIPVVWLEPQIVNKENIDDVIIKSGFHTSGEVYR